MKRRRWLKTSFFLIVFVVEMGSAIRTANAAQSALSLDDRVEFQRRIEEVYWRHRAAQSGETTKRSFPESISTTDLRAKVEDTLRKSAALAQYWQRPVTSAQLQAEMERMATQTKQPEVLRELWTALDNDPFVIAECLARPLLVERELQSWYAKDERFHGGLRSHIEAELQTRGKELKTLTGEHVERRLTRGGDGRKSAAATDDKTGALSERDWQLVVGQLAEVFGLAPNTDASSALRELSGQVSGLQESETHFYIVSIVNAGAEELDIATVNWAKEPVASWLQKMAGEFAAADASVGAPARYELPRIAATAGGDDTWRPTNAPLSARERHTAVWTGSEMIVWGGFYNTSNFTNYSVTVGSRYNPSTDTWSLTRTVNAPAWRQYHTAVWTGSEMIVWGGYGGEIATTATGARYNPTTDVWTPTSTSNAPSARSRHTAVWTGSRMLVWGGRTGDTDDTTINTGSIYDPAANSWTAMTTSNAPAGRQFHTALWTGNVMIVWGGYDGASSSGVSSGGRYDPQSNTWQATSNSPLSARYGHTAVWTGTRMLVWGGQGPNFFTYSFFNTGAAYDPATNLWSAISTTNAPSPRSAAGSVWTGSEWIVWGGNDSNNRLRNGDRYNPQSNTWQTLSTAGAPQSSVLMSILWTGSEMIVWGGQEPTNASDVNTGARYNPQTDSWLPVTNPQNGGPRTEHPAVWTGAEMIVWGSYAIGAAPTNTGARYYPSTDTWLPTSMVNVPRDRYAPTGVWSGSEMIVWGGCADSFCFSRLNTGGRYNPATNSWQATSTVDAAAPRYYHTAVWSGTEMIVWGGCNAQTCGPGGGSDPNGLNTGARYNPQSDSWQPTSLSGVPTSRWTHVGVWTGNEMVVWGGISGSGPFSTGGRYNPATDIWRPTITTNAPTARQVFRAVWTGSRMFIWGGYNSLLDQDFSTGGLYDPGADAWTATSLTNAPSARHANTVVWTGEEAIVWGGSSGPNHQIDTNTGGRYNPQTNTWRSTSTLEAPSARDVHSAVWTGSEMIVFGGESCARCEPVLDTGGVYRAIGAPTAIAAVSRRVHDSAGVFDLPLALTGSTAIEPRSGGATGDYQLIVTFNSSVSVNGSPQAQVMSGNAQIGSNGAANGGSVTVNGSTVTIPLTNVADAQTLIVRLSSVTNSAGSTSVDIPLRILVGDTNGDATVNAADVAQTRGRAGQALDATTFRSDVNGDGAINSGDVTIVRGRSGNSVAATP